LKTPQTIFVFGVERRQELERNLATEASIEGQINLTHASRAERGENLEAAKTGTDGDSHNHPSVGEPKAVYHRDQEISMLLTDPSEDLFHSPGRLARIKQRRLSYGRESYYKSEESSDVVTQLTTWHDEKPDDFSSL